MPDPQQRIERTDALVIGGGPIGLLVAAQLLKFKCSAIVVEKDDKPSMPIYGRATTLWCRTLELLDQLDLCEPLMEVGCFTKDGINFRDGKAAPGGLTFGQRMHKHGDTRFNMSLHLRQRLIERKFEQALEDLGSPSRHHTVLEGFTVDESKEYPVTSVLKDLHTDETYTVESKTMVGVDGGHSFVRKTAGIEFKGDRSANKWIRLDAIIETDMPSPRTLNSVQSDTHGLVLWCPIDSGRVRMGYVFSQALQEKYGESGVTGEVAMEEAKKAVAPFKLDFKKLDWFTLYGIGQCMAETFQKGPVFLAGDACHTHSSGSAQGLNTGTFDAVNLAWKLALYLRGHATKELVESYSTEREVGVKQVIDNDRIIATLISGQLPEKYKGRTEPPRVILDEWFNDARNVAFTLGLGVQYPADNLINVSRSGQALSTVGAGERGPETYVTRLGTNERTPLQRLMPNTGSFHVVLFGGIPRDTQSSLQKLRTAFDERGENWEEKYPRGVVKVLTLLAATGPSATDVLGGMESFGRTFYDSALEAHCAYGVDPVRGAIIVFRPDGYIGTVAPLAGPELVSEYFARFLIPRGKEKAGALTNGTNGASKQNGH